VTICSDAAGSAGLVEQRGELRAVMTDRDIDTLLEQTDNCICMHSALGYRPPFDFEQELGQLRAEGDHQDRLVPHLPCLNRGRSPNCCHRDCTAI
jgi:hypothetical protein